MKHFVPALMMFLGLSQQAAAVEIAPEAIPLAGPMVADISQTEIQIHSGFRGTQLLVFGARNSKGDLVIVVRGPQANITLRRKERIAGMWMHVDQHKYEHLPMFYAVAATRPLRDIAPRYLLQRLGLGERQAILGSNLEAKSNFDLALRAMLERKMRWQEPFDRITFFGESLFKARLNLPDNLPNGNYSVEVYLFDNGKPVAFQTIPMRVFKTGMDARIYDVAQHRSWLYGFAAIIMALSVGWLAHRLFHRTRDDRD